MNGQKSKVYVIHVGYLSIVQVYYDGSVVEVDTESPAPANTLALRARNIGQFSNHWGQVGHFTQLDARPIRYLNHQGLGSPLKSSSHHINTG